ncbi:type III-B CRISPR module RAMP protein Cmr6 [Clostridium luticellarii]|uniref:RAMP superfamily protein n=1 Tax=Clostridium luticellarii TaxID=1691940 RepID=A0A2T0B619_9CLOT|nr:type III-B CRISPR module RAMP protein Cmr6 [Clostridium luticellarii]PRR79326.1 RAMP superfamily protein [Clostridium luticellarii]
MNDKLKINYKKENGKYILEFKDQQNVNYYGYNELIDAVSKDSLDAFNYSLKLNKFSGLEGSEDNYNKIRYDDIDNILEKIKCNTDLILENTKEQYHWISFDGKLIDKMAIGFGGQSVFEGDITLHHIYGIPYIPGQAIKGNLRNYITRKYTSEKEVGILNDNSFISIFGKELQGKTSGSQGKVIFLDSYPVDGFEIKKDVMSTHYNEYYQGNSLPSDTEKIIVNDFMVVKNASFNFNIGISSDILNRECTLDKDKNIVEFILENIIDVLRYNGLGAKTSVGYGFFDLNKGKIVNQIKKRSQMQKAEMEKKKFEEETKGMTEFQIEMYKFDKITDLHPKNDEVMKLFNNSTFAH